MTPFSFLLSSHIKNKNIRTHQLAQFCGVDRSNMYKFINGKRNPTSEHLVNKICDFIKLTPVERRELLEAYQVTLVGHDTYYRRKNTQQFIMNFAKFSTHIPSFSATITSGIKNPDGQECISIQSKESLYRIIYNILAAEAQKANGFIKLILQPSSGYFMEILSYICKNKYNLKLEHIICLNNTNDITTNKLHYNLNCLREILPLYYTCLCDYTPFCYYDSIISHDSIFNVFSSMIVTSDYALIFSPAMQNGVLFIQKNTVRNFHQIFDKLKSETTPAVCKIDSLFTQFSYFEELDTHNSPGFSFQQQPCMIPLLPLSFLDRYIIRELPDRIDFIDSVARYIKEKSRDFMDHNSRFIFTEKGIAEFLNNGRIFEFPDALYHALAYKDRLMIIRNLISACKSGKYKMLRPDTPIIDSNLSIYANSQNGYLLFTTTDGNLVYLNLEEQSLLFSFYDYLESLDDNWFYSDEETIEILKTLIKAKESS